MKPSQVATYFFPSMYLTILYFSMWILSAFYRCRFPWFTVTHILRNNASPKMVAKLLKNLFQCHCKVPATTQALQSFSCTGMIPGKLLPRSTVLWLTIYPPVLWLAEASLYSEVGPFWGEGEGGCFRSVRSLDWYKESFECGFKDGPVKTAPDMRSGSCSVNSTLLKLTLISCHCFSASKDAWKTGL